MIEDKDILLAKVTTNTLLMGYVKKLNGNINPEQKQRLETLKTDVVHLYQTIREMEHRLNKLESMNFDLMIDVQRLTKENERLKEENKNLYQGL